MASPTTLRGELLRERKTFNNKFFLTLGSSNAGMSPYNPIHLGIGVTLRVQTNGCTNAIRMTLKRVTDGPTETARTITVTKVSDTEWRAEGAIGGSRLGFPQPAPDYHTPQCFELTMIARNLGRTIERVYNFWVAEGPAGTITECIDREMIGVKPLVCCFDGLSFRDPIFAWPDEFASFFANNNPPTMSCIEDEGESLPPDPALGVYVVGLPEPLFGLPAVENPFARGNEPSPTGLDFPFEPGSPEYTVNGIDQTGLLPAGSVWGFDFPTVASGLTHPVSLFNDKGWVLTPREPHLSPTTTWLVSPLLDFRNYQNALVEFYLWEDVEFDGGVRLQYTQDEGATWTDIPAPDYSLPLIGGDPPMSLFGGSDDKIVVPPQTMTRVVVDLSQFDGQTVRVRWCHGLDGGAPVDAVGDVVSGIKYFAQAGPIIQMESDMDRLRAGHGDQWKYQSISELEKLQQGRLNKGPIGSPAAVPPAGGTGVVNLLAAHINVGNDTGGLLANLGYSRGIEGPEIELVSDDDLGPAPNDFIINLSIPAWLGGSWDFAICAGIHATWAGPPGTVGLGYTLTTVEQLISSITSLYSGVPIVPGGAWVIGGISTIGLLAAGSSVQLTLTQLGSGVGWGGLIGLDIAVSVVIWPTGGGPLPPGAGLLASTFPDQALRSNVLRFVVVP